MMVLLMVETSMAKLTKTQIALLKRAAFNPDNRVSVLSGVVTSRKHGAYGTRERDAAASLRDLGFLVYVRGYHTTHHLSHRQGSDIGSDTVWQVTDAGRRALMATKGG
jgi:hypothetical protein